VGPYRRLAHEGPPELYRFREHPCSTISRQGSLEFVCRGFLPNLPFGPVARGALRAPHEELHFPIACGVGFGKGVRAWQRPVGRYLEALSVRCPRALSEGELGMWVRCVHDVLAVHDGQRVTVGSGCELHIREEELAALGWHHAPEVGVAGIIHRDSVPAS
jgi:hypothetical protein